MSPPASNPAATDPAATDREGPDQVRSLEIVPDSLLREGPVTVTVRGACMEPWIRDGARVVLTPRRRYWPGDLVGFRARDGRLTVHRLVGLFPSRAGLRFVTQADAAGRADSSVPAHRVLGRVSGGECAPEAVRIPVRHRLRALGRAGIFLLHAVAHRLRTAARALDRRLRTGGGEERS